jgi:hypothetical protein
MSSAAVKEAPNNASSLAQNTTVIAEELFSPLSYSLSVAASAASRHRPQGPPPPPSALKSTEKSADWSRLLSFSQQDCTPRSILENKSSTPKKMKQELQELLVYIDNLAFSPHAVVVGGGAAGGSSRKQPKSAIKPSHSSLPPKSAKKVGRHPPRNVLGDRTNNTSRSKPKPMTKQPYPEMTPFKPRSRPRDPSVSPPKHNTSRYQLREDDDSSVDNENEDEEEKGSLIVEVSSSPEPELLEEEDDYWQQEPVEPVRVATAVRRALDPEPTLLDRKPLLDDSIFVGTADADLLRDRTSISHLTTHFDETSFLARISPDRSLPSPLCQRTNTSAAVHTPAAAPLLGETKDDDDGGKKVLRRVATPEDAKQLLRTAVDALQDARSERESARQWAQSMKESVHKWAEEQRKLIRCETSTRIDALQEKEQQVRHQTVSLGHLEESLEKVYKEITCSNQHRQGTEERLQQLLLEQHEKIHALSQQLSSIEQTMTEHGTRSGASPRGGWSPTKQGQGQQVGGGAFPKFVDKPTGTRNSSSSQTSTSSSRIRRQLQGGGHEIVYGNGVRKEVHKDGTTRIRFSNGDVETRFAESGTVAYFHNQEQVMQITTKDGSTLFEYPNQQIERHYPDGSKAIIFPDGTKQRFSASGEVETHFS